MFWLTKVIVPALLVLAVGTAVVMADADGNQPPFGKGGFGQPGKGFPGKGDDKKKDDKKVEEKKVDEKKSQPGEKKGPPPVPQKADPQVEAWLAILLTKITDPHDTVRESARGAIVSVGPSALPALQKLADGDDSAKAVAARKMIGAISGRGPGQPGQPGPQGGRTGGGFGGGGFGGGGMGGGPGGGFPGMPGMGPMGGPGGPGGFPGQPGMNPGGGRGGPGGFPGMGPGGGGGGGRGGWGGFGGGRGGREESDIEVAPMPRSAR